MQCEKLSDKQTLDIVAKVDLRGVFELSRLARTRSRRLCSGRFAAILSREKYKVAKKCDRNKAEKR